MVKFLKFAGLILIFASLLFGIYLFYDAIDDHYTNGSRNPHDEETFIVNLYVGIILIIISSISGILYISFVFVIELLDGINRKVYRRPEPPKKEE